MSRIDNAMMLRHEGGVMKDRYVLLLALVLTIGLLAPIVVVVVVVGLFLMAALVIGWVLVVTSPKALDNRGRNTLFWSLICWDVLFVRSSVGRLFACGLVSVFVIQEVRSRKFKEI